MPVMDGLEFLQKMRADSTLRQLIVLIVTAVTSRAVEVTARELGAAGFIRKPFYPVQIREEVIRALAKAGREPPPMPLVHYRSDSASVKRKRPHSGLVLGLG